MNIDNVPFLISMAGISYLSAVTGHFVNKYSMKYIKERERYRKMLLEQTKFEYKYMEEFLQTNRNELTDQERKELANKHIRLDTEQGEIVMFYDHEKASFVWYCNTKEVPYKYLETVARKYVIDNNCSCIYAVMHEELNKGRERQAEARRKHEESLKEPNKVAATSSVFASFKSYNKKSATEMIQNKNWLFKENANRYSYRGKLEDYDKLINSNTSDTVRVVKTVNFADFVKSRQAEDNESTTSSTTSSSTID